jgi:hypothetical protein
MRLAIQREIIEQGRRDKKRREKIVGSGRFAEVAMTGVMQ